MGYLLPTDYENYGLAPDTTDDWITVASALIDTYCRRQRLTVTQYTERFRLVRGSPGLQLSYLPLAPVAPAITPLITVQARYRTSRADSPENLEYIWSTFALPGSWIILDTASIDWTLNGSITLPCSLFGQPFGEIQVEYTAGLTTIPDPVKSACALIIKNAQSTSGMNIKSSRIDTLQIQYFSDQLVDNTVKTMLRPWVASRLG